MKRKDDTKRVSVVLWLAAMLMLPAMLGPAPTAKADELSDPFDYTPQWYPGPGPTDRMLVSPGDTFSFNVVVGLQEPPTPAFPVMQTEGWQDNSHDGWIVTYSPAPPYTWDSAGATITVTVTVQVPSDAPEGYEQIVAHLKPGRDKNGVGIGEGTGVHIRLTVGASSTEVGSISGHKFDDADADGQWDSGESPVPDWQVHLTGNGADDYAFTDAAGKFIFGNLLPGSYTVEEVFPSPPPKWLATTPTSFTHELTAEEDYVGPAFGNVRLGSISGSKFYDADVGGDWDGGEPPIAGWKVHLTGTNVKGDALDAYAFTDAGGKFKFEDLLSGTYTVEEILPPAPPTWVATTNPSFDRRLAEGEDYVAPDFGNVCLQAGSGGLTLGFWTNKNGQALIATGDVTALNVLNLFKPAGRAYPPFSATLATAKTQINSYLLSATAVDMRWMLSAQLIATELDVRHLFLSGSTIVDVGPSSYVASGFITIADIMAKANIALGLGPDARAEQEYWKNLLDNVNNNRLPFVCGTPCPVVYP